MNQNGVLLSVIVPCYNEKENLERGVLNEVLTFLNTLPFKWELIISDDGSTDNSREMISNFIKGRKQIILLENRHGGKPAAIYAGAKAAHGEYILFTDMDQSTPIWELNKLLPYFKQYEVIIGSRIERKNFPFYRKIGSKVFKTFRKAILLKDINDTQCGFKAFKKSLALELFPRLRFFKQLNEIKGWKVTSFDVELLYLAEIKKKRIKEVPVDWEDRDITKGKDKKYFKESKEMLIEILRVKLNDLRGVYKKLEIR